MQVDGAAVAQEPFNELEKSGDGESVLGLLLKDVETLFGGIPLVEAIVVVLRLVSVAETLIWPNKVGTMRERLTRGHLHGCLLDTWQIPLHPMLNVEARLGEEGILVLSPMPRFLRT